MDSADSILSKPKFIVKLIPHEISPHLGNVEICVDSTLCAKKMPKDSRDIEAKNKKKQTYFSVVNERQFLY